MNSEFQTTNVLGVPYAELDYEGATNAVMSWASEGSHRVVVVAPVNGLMLARWRKDVRRSFERADMITSDGMPIVWARWLMGRIQAKRLYGPDFMLHVARACEQQRLPVALLGGRPERLSGLVSHLAARFPELSVPYSWSPPFRDLSDSEVEMIAEDIAASGARVVFVGIGCPKQELLMARLAPLLPCVQLGVGAAFDFIPGYVRQAPPKLQAMGLEWAFRVACEPRRLWRRYATTIPPFVLHVSWQILAHNCARAIGRGAGAV